MKIIRLKSLLLNDYFYKFRRLVLQDLSSLIKIVYEDLAITYPIFPVNNEYPFLHIVTFMGLKVFTSNQLIDIFYQSQYHNNDVTNMHKKI